jgi:hypothetical protein
VSDAPAGLFNDAAVGVDYAAPGDEVTPSKAKAKTEPAPEAPPEPAPEPAAAKSSK